MVVTDRLSSLCECMKLVELCLRVENVVGTLVASVVSRLVRWVAVVNL